MENISTILKQMDCYEPHLLSFSKTFENIRVGFKRSRFRVLKSLQQGMLCHWCKCAMTLQCHHTKHGTPADNYATFEHLYDSHCDFGRIDDTDYIVMACRKCNNARNIKNMRAKK